MKTALLVRSRHLPTVPARHIYERQDLRQPRVSRRRSRDVRVTSTYTLIADMALQDKKGAKGQSLPVRLRGDRTRRSLISPAARWLGGGRLAEYLNRVLLATASLYSSDSVPPDLQNSMRAILYFFVQHQPGNAPDEHAAD